MEYEVIFQAAVTALSIMVAGFWFLWQRYQALEKRFGQIESELTMQKHRQELYAQVTDANRLNIQQLVDSNKALIEHRTKRFMTQIHEVEQRLGCDIKEIKNWLDAHTEFKIRER